MGQDKAVWQEEMQHLLPANICWCISICNNMLCQSMTYSLLVMRWDLMDSFRHKMWFYLLPNPGGHEIRCKVSHLSSCIWHTLAVSLSGDMFWWQTNGFPLTDCVWYEEKWLEKMVFHSLTVTVTGWEVMKLLGRKVHNIYSLLVMPGWWGGGQRNKAVPHHLLVMGWDTIWDCLKKSSCVTHSLQVGHGIPRHDWSDKEIKDCNSLPVGHGMRHDWWDCLARNLKQCYSLPVGHGIVSMIDEIAC